MVLDKKYLNKLKAPLKSKLGLSASEYFACLDKAGVHYAENDARLTSEFIFHIEYLIDAGVITGPCQNESGIKKLGIRVGSNRNAVITNQGLIQLNTKNTFQKASLILAWLNNHVVAGVMVIVFGALALMVLGIN